ncbi:GGDEF domain-containing protein [Agrobacterium larrymoorei]|uniref:diguanylate cyclase n=1 Tax=Agrobacterium larrymoorei TaxID=160699 RepID=A0ABU0UQ77_9HYPH|nr:GGDEF domain-containing protein [Agrobacterium larrymoorei]MDQ1187104.1 diguanylate cyclase (GGDEF)-like protein [Agrobacterium larrymoorei]
MKKIKSSFVAKTFLVCFVSVHVPLIALAVYLALGFQPGTLSVLLLILGATLVGTALCLFAIWRLIRPLNLLADAMRRYPEDKGILRLYPKSRDEIGTVTDIARSTLSQVENLTKQLKHQAMTDFLTGLGNRRALMEQMPIIRAKAARPEEAVSLILFDLDHFKRINDEYGHDAGDSVLMAIGEAVKDHLRPYDYAARMGGEEFCIVLPGADLAAAETVAERLRRAVESRVVEPLPEGRITCSFGVAQARPNERLQELLLRADAALYTAKDRGRNLVVRAEP